jgi:hypothetical protein
LEFATETEAVEDGAEPREFVGEAAAAWAAAGGGCCTLSGCWGCWVC